MGLDASAGCQNYSKEGKSPKIASTSHRHASKVQKRRDNGKLTHEKYLLKSLGHGLRESSDGKTSIPARKSMPSTLSRVTVTEDVKRGSIYQSSESVRQMKKLGVKGTKNVQVGCPGKLSPSRKSMPSALSKVTIIEELKRGSIYQSSESVQQMTKLKGTRNIQSLRNSDSSLTFTIIDSLSRPKPRESNSLAKQKRSPLVSLNADQNSTSVSTNYILPTSSESLDASYLLPEDRSITQNPSDGFLEICLDSGYLAGEPKVKCVKTASPEDDSNSLAERETLLKLPKSASAKVGLPEPPCQEESKSSKVNPKARLSPLRRMFSPTLKSKSLRNPPISLAETNDPVTIGSECIRRNKTPRKSLLLDFSKANHKTECDGQLNKGGPIPIKAPSPVHLHGLLRLEQKHGMPFFEFFLNDQEDVLSARTWRTENALNWLYTFHSVSTKRKSNSNGWGTKARYKESSMVGQMQVTCYLCSEMRNAGSLDNSTVMEFVLYDIAQARKSFAIQDQPANVNGESSAFGKDDSDPFIPWVSDNLHPHLEIAAIVIQVPFEKTQNLKDKKADVIPNSMGPVNVKVVTASRTHGLPSTEESGPSPLLDRWRSGGGCDCGGWDMACPVMVLDNPSIKNVADSAFVANQWSLELFAQGAKDELPSLTITVVDEGQYSVYFHAQLSTLQAFAICVALLHKTEVSPAVAQERCSQRLQCKSLKSLLQEEVRILMEAVVEEEKRKEMKKKEGNLPPYLVLDPPFSPIGRV